MSKDKVDVLMHLTTQTQDRQWLELQQDLEHRAGILAMFQNPHHHNMMLVEYDPEQTSAQRILACIGRHGIEAHLVGL